MEPSQEVTRISNYVDQLETELMEKRTTEKKTADAITNMFSGAENDNLIKWQLSIEEELAKIEHLLRRHVPTIVGDNIRYVESPNTQPILNEEGVQEILGMLAWYLNKNLILSNYDKDEIKVRVYQFHVKFSNFIFLNAKKFGMDNQEKLRYYPMIVMNVVNSIEATYFRAMNGEERESFRTARMVHQTENPSMGMFMNSQVPAKNKFNLFDPRTWKA